LEREVAFGVAHRQVGRPDVAAALPARGAGGELEAAHLLFGQRRLGVGVILAAREQAPEQARELARRGDDGDRVPALGLDALIEGGDRAGLADGRPARLDERVTRAARSLPGDVAVVGGSGAGLFDLGVEAEVSGQLAPIGGCRRWRP
jgi:hypothetical protein